MSIAKRGNNILGKGGASLIKLTQNIYPPIELPTVITSETTTKNATSIRTGGDVTNGGYSAITAKGMCYNTSPNPLITDSSTSDGINAGSWLRELEGLSSSTTYYVRAWAANAIGIAYGDDASTTTHGGVSEPIVSTVAATNVRFNDMSFTGNVTYDGGSTVFAKGIYVSTDPNPTELNSDILSGGTGLGSYTIDWADYSSQTLYYYRAYAENVTGIGLGTISSISSPLKTAPIITTDAPSSVSVSSIACRGTMDDIGDDPVSEYGYLFGNSPGLSYPDDIFTSWGPWEYQYNGESGTFWTGHKSGLDHTTTYYYRTYAINTQGTTLGNEISQATDPIVVPSLTTDNAVGPDYYPADSSLGNFKWHLHGTITSDGNATVTRFGAIYSKLSGKFLADVDNIDTFSTIDNTPNGETDLNLYTSTYLDAETTYYYKHFATNLVGDGYGPEQTFYTGAPGSIDLHTLVNDSGGGNAFNMGGKFTNGLGETGVNWGYVWANEDNTDPVVGGLGCTAWLITSNYTINSVGYGGYNTFEQSTHGANDNEWVYFKKYAEKDGTYYYGNLGAKRGLIGQKTLAAHTDNATTIFRDGGTLVGRSTFNEEEAIQIHAGYFVATDYSGFDPEGSYSSELVEDFTTSTAGGVTTHTYSGDVAWYTDINGASDYMVPGGTYYYRFRFYFNGEMYYGDEQSFTTNNVPLTTLKYRMGVSPYTETTLNDGDTITGAGTARLTLYKNSIFNLDGYSHTWSVDWGDGNTYHTFDAFNYTSYKFITNTYATSGTFTVSSHSAGYCNPNNYETNDIDFTLNQA